MMLLVLLLASSGIVLASPRVRGTPVAQSGTPHPYQPYGSPPHQFQAAAPGYRPTVQIENQPNNNDPNSVLVRISPEDLRYFQLQQAGSPSHSPSTVDRQAPVPVPSSQFEVEFNVGNSASPSLEPVQVRQSQNSPQVNQYSTVSQNTPQRRKRLQQAIIGSSVRKFTNSNIGAQLFRTVPPVEGLERRLPSNYSRILKEPAVDTFRCDDREYGYYADVDNNCQIFHVCVPYGKLHPGNFTSDYTIQYSFICNEYTMFSQASQTCEWEDETFPCEFSPDLYEMNRNYFRRIVDEDGERYAHLNDPIF